MATHKVRFHNVGLRRRMGYDAVLFLPAFCLVSFHANFMAGIVVVVDCGTRACRGSRHPGTAQLTKWLLCRAGTATREAVDPNRSWMTRDELELWSTQSSHAPSADQLGVRPVRPRQIPKVKPDMMCSAWKGMGISGVWRISVIWKFGRMLRISRRAGSILLVLLAMSKVWNDLEPMKRPCRSCILYIVHTIDALTLTWIYHFQPLRWHWPVPSRNPKAPHVAFGSVEVSKQDWTLTELRFVLDFVIVVSQMLSDCDSVRCFSMFEHKKPHEVVTLVLRCKWPNWTREVLPLAEAVSKYSVQILRVRCVRF